MYPNLPRPLTLRHRCFPIPALPYVPSRSTHSPEYRQLVKRLSEGLSESIEAEASGASEAEVRDRQKGCGGYSSYRSNLGS